MLPLFPDATEEQRLMAESAIGVMETEYPLTAVREWAERSERGDERLWRTLGGLGCFRLLAGETLSGNGLADAAVLAAERGARLQPGPFTGTQVTVAALSWHAVSDLSPVLASALRVLVSGEAAATWAVDAPPGDGLPAEPYGLRVAEDTDGFTVSGTLRAVQDADACDWILVTTRAGGVLRQFLMERRVAGLTLRKATGLDVTRRQFTLDLEGVRVPSAAVLPGDSGALADWLLAVAAVLSAAESVGAMHADFALAVQYAKDRTAFGRPIGSFQGLKHLLARTSLALEMATGLIAGAAEGVGGGADDAPVLASIARAFVSENAVELAQNCFQVFGGIGFTWEHDQHLYLRRLASEAYLAGSPAWHRRRVWDLGRQLEAAGA